MKENYKIISVENLDEVFNLIRKCSEKLETEGYFHWNRYSKNAIKSKIFNTESYGLFKGNKLIGFVAIHEKEQAFINDKNRIFFKGNKDFIYFSTLAILPEFQGQGYAKKLIDFVKFKAREYNKKYLRMAYISNNKKLVEFYKNLGFKNVYTGYVGEVDNDVSFGEFYL